MCKGLLGGESWATGWGRSNDCYNCAIVSSHCGFFGFQRKVE